MDTYVKGKDKYEKKGKKYVTEYAPEDKHFFPRMWDNSNDQGHADYYASFAGIGKDQKTGVTQISQPWAIISVSLLVTSLTGCTGGILCGILPENKTISRVWIWAM